MCVRGENSESEMIKVDDKNVCSKKLGQKLKKWDDTK